MHLLDINVLLALVDADHVHHQRTRSWFLSSARQAWATCPITENGFVRILSHTAYPGFGREIEDARMALKSLVSFPGHQFWSDDLSLLDMEAIPKLSGSKHLTDLYLLALAVQRKAYFATLDERIDPGLIPGGAKACDVLPN